MLKAMLKNKIIIRDRAESWQEAIRIAAGPLLEEEYIEEQYIDAMVESVQNNGPYMIILPDVAIPHARPEYGVRRTGISLLRLSEGVVFPEDKGVRLLIVLAAEDSEKHIELISKLADILIEDDILAAVLAAKTQDEVLELL